MPVNTLKWNLNSTFLATFSEKNNNIQVISSLNHFLNY